MWFRRKRQHEVVVKVVKAPHFDETAPKYNFTVFIQDLETGKPVMWKAGRSWKQREPALEFARKISKSSGWKINSSGEKVKGLFAEVRGGDFPFTQLNAKPSASGSVRKISEDREERSRSLEEIAKRRLKVRKNRNNGGDQ